MLMCLIAQVTTVKLWLAGADVNLLCTLCTKCFFSTKMDMGTKSVQLYGNEVQSSPVQKKTKMDIGSGVCTFGVLYR
jgi:hypothetical protein